MTFDATREVVLSLVVRCNFLAMPDGRIRGLRSGDRCNLTIHGKYFPCCCENIEDVVAPEQPCNVLLRAILMPEDLPLQQDAELELREGPHIFAACRLISYAVVG